MNTLTYSIALVTVECPTCYMTYGIPRDLYDAAKEKNAAVGRSMVVYCPSGHTWHYTGRNEAQLAKQQAERLSQELAWANTRALRTQAELDHEKRRVAAAKGRITKLKNRIAKGICPCCNRYFAALHRHVAQEHPEYVLPEGVTLNG